MTLSDLMDPLVASGLSRSEAAHRLHAEALEDPDKARQLWRAVGERFLLFVLAQQSRPTHTPLAATPGRPWYDHPSVRRAAVAIGNTGVLKTLDEYETEDARRNRQFCERMAETVAENARGWLRIERAIPKGKRLKHVWSDLPSKDREFLAREAGFKPERQDAKVA